MCRRGSYEEVCRQLFGAAGLEGLGYQTKVIGLIDGANGLQEAMEMPFADLQVILDPSHLRHHFWETSKAMGETEETGEHWIDGHCEQIARGHAIKVVAELQSESDRRSIDGPTAASKQID